MNVGEIAVRVKRQFGDDAGVQVTDDDIIRWVNDAQREIASKNDLLQTIGTTVVISNQGAYTVPADLLLLRSVHYKNSKLKSLNTGEAEEYLGSNNAPGVPEVFWVYGNQINLYPAPAVGGSTDLKLFYTKRPTDVTVTGNTPELPLEYHSRIVEYCLQQAYELDENWAAAQTKAQQFTEGVQQTRLNSDTQAFYPTITTLPEWD